MLVTVPVSPSDQAFLFEVYTSTRREELSAMGWDEGSQRTFLLEQFQLREEIYSRQCPHAERLILLHQDQRAGAAILCRRPHEIRLVDLALLPAFRNLGIGTALLRLLQAEAERTHRRVGLQVQRRNPARRLYERLGFVKTSQTPSHLSMVWTPGGRR